MKRHSKNNRNASNAGNTSELLAATIATKWCNTLVDDLFKIMEDEIDVTNPWTFSIRYTSYYNFFYDSYESQIEDAKQKGKIDEETIDYLFQLAPLAANLCMFKLKEKLNFIINQWGFPEISCYFVDEENAKILNKNITYDALVFFVSTKKILDVGDVIGSWIVVERDTNGETARVSNGVNEITLKLVATETGEDGSTSEYCWIHVG